MASPTKVMGSALTGTAVAVLMWLLALTSPSYHTLVFSLFYVQYVLADFSLWRVHLRSDCRSLLGRITGATRERGIPYRDAGACRWVIHRLDGKPIDEAVDLACQVQTAMFNLSSAGCYNLGNLAAASRFFLVTIFFTMLCDVIIGVGIAIFFHCRPTRRLRNVILVSAFAAALTASLGLFVYVYVGGQLSTDDVVSLPIARDSSVGFTSWNTGLVVAFAAGGFQLLLSGGLCCLLRPSYCADGEGKDGNGAEGDDDDEETADELLLRCAGHYPYPQMSNKIIV